MLLSRHVIRNLGAHPTTWKKIKATVLFNIGFTNLWWRKPFLTEEDYRASMSVIRPGDLVLVGNHRKVVALIMRGIVTHSLLYVGEGECIHANADGVEQCSYRELFDFYDTLIVVRINTSDEHRQRAISWTRDKLGLPYDYNFDPTSHREWFCTKLICGAYAEAHAKLSPCVHKRVVFPRELVSSFGTRIFHSTSLCEQENDVVLNPTMYKNSLLRKILTS